jgi:hypothetical protein
MNNNPSPPGNHDEFDAHEWRRSFVNDFVGGTIMGGVATAISGGADAGTGLIAGAAGGAIWGLVDYPSRYLLKRYWR